jgi:hypothetical protein
VWEEVAKGAVEPLFGVDPVRWTVCHLGCFGFLEHLHLIGNRG